MAALPALSSAAGAAWPVPASRVSWAACGGGAAVCVHRCSVLIVAACGPCGGASCQASAPVQPGVISCRSARFATRGATGKGCKATRRSPCAHGAKPRSRRPDADPEDPATPPGSGNWPAFSLLPPILVPAARSFASLAAALTLRLAAPRAGGRRQRRCTTTSFFFSRRPRPPIRIPFGVCRPGACIGGPAAEELALLGRRVSGGGPGCYSLSAGEGSVPGLAGSSCRCVTHAPGEGCVSGLAESSFRSVPLASREGAVPRLGESAFRILTLASRDDCRAGNSSAILRVCGAAPSTAGRAESAFGNLPPAPRESFVSGVARPVIRPPDPREVSAPGLAAPLGTASLGCREGSATGGFGGPSGALGSGKAPAALQDGFLHVGNSSAPLRACRAALMPSSSLLRGAASPTVNRDSSVPGSEKAPATIQDGFLHAGNGSASLRACRAAVIPSSSLLRGAASPAVNCDSSMPGSGTGSATFQDGFLHTGNGSVPLRACHAAVAPPSSVLRGAASPAVAGKAPATFQDGFLHAGNGSAPLRACRAAVTPSSSLLRGAASPAADGGPPSGTGALRRLGAVELDLGGLPAAGVSVRRREAASGPPSAAAAAFSCGKDGHEVRVRVGRRAGADAGPRRRTIEAMMLDGTPTEVTCRVDTSLVEQPFEQAHGDGKGMLFSQGDSRWRRWPYLFERKWRFSGFSKDSLTPREREQWKALFASGIEAPTFARPKAKEYLKITRLILAELKIDVAGLAASVAMMLLSKSLSARAPGLLREAVDTLQREVARNGINPARGLASGSRVLRILALQFATQIAQVACSELQTTLFAKVGEATRRAVMLRVFSHLHALDFIFHTGRSPGAVQRILDRGAGALGLTAAALVFEFVPNAVELLFMNNMLRRSLGDRISNVSVATMAAYGAWSVPLIHWGARFKQEMNRYDNIVGSRVTDSLTNHLVVKLYNNEAEELQKYTTAQRAYGAATVRFRNSVSLLTIGQKVILTTGLSVMLKRLMDEVARGKSTIGDLVLLKAYAMQARRPLEAMGHMYRKVFQGLTDVTNLFQLLHHVKPALQDAPQAKEMPPGQGRIVFKNVHFAYPMQAHPGTKQKPTLSDFNLVVHPGELVGIVGLSGSGKTTIARLLTRLVEPASGQITIDGVDVNKEVTAKSLRDNVVVVPQEPMLFNDTIAYNIMYGKLSADDAAVQLAARKAQVHSSIMAKRDGYHTIIGTTGNQLSGGERQRIAVARALLKAPRVLIYDEATSSLDATTEAGVMESISSRKDKPTTLIIAHRLSTVRNADRIIVLAGGRVAESGSHEQLIRMKSRYATLWNQQMGGSGGAALKSDA
ncbi:ABC transporter B family member 25 [Diplonema papillatum]|nr:ABC transporter B family member 25 [Diplonema papillatum]KAJ9451394.1 ABC transporter B family member 25 [Diplonema papillatum]